MEVIILSLIITFIKKSSADAEDDADLIDLMQRAPVMVLTAHNHYRLQYNLPVLRLKVSLNNRSQEWAEHLAAERKTYSKPNNIYGENHYFQKNSSVLPIIPAIFVKIWYLEIKRRPIHLVKMRNVTQMLWKSTKYLGVSLIVNRYNEVYMVCFYEPKGNIERDYYHNFILPVLIKKDDVYHCGKSSLKEFNFILLFIIVINHLFRLFVFM